MLSRKKRDAKFLIFQSLYLIAISILFYKGTDLSLNKVMAVENGDTVIAKKLLAEDTSIVRIEKEILDSLMDRPVVDVKNDSVIDRGLLAQLTQRANENNKTPITSIPKTVIPVPIPPKEEKTPDKTADKKPDKKPSPIQPKDVTEGTLTPFTNPSSEKKMLVYQDGSLLGIVGPNRTKSLLVKSGGKITYGYSD